MKVKSLYLILSILFIAISAQGQLILRKNGSKKVVKTGRFLNLGQELNKNKTCCDVRYLKGTLLSSSQDSVTLDIVSEEIILINELRKEVRTIVYQKEPNSILEVTIPKDEIRFMEINKSMKSKKNRRNAFGVGGLMIMGGLVNGVASIFYKENKYHLITSGVLLGAGALTMVIFNDKKYKIHPSKQNLWMIE